MVGAAWGESGIMQAVLTIKNQKKLNIRNYDIATIDQLCLG
jgi:hypothetical protein